MADELIEFNIEKVSPSIIMVAGVGGGGSNAVNHMFDLGIADVTFMVCNTDKQALYRSPVPIKIKLGEHLTEGLGAGNNPERGRAAALESLDEIVSVFKREGTKMVFITAGMGGGTGTGAAPIIAKAAKELGILTVGIVTLPFKTEGKKRSEHALIGVEELRQNVDSLLVINNENIQEIYGKLTLTEAFGKADDILATAAKGIAEIITGDGVVNVDFADVKTVMSDSGVALMGSGRASGQDRAMTVADLALSSPLLNHNYINGAKNILINITSGQDEIRLEETGNIIEYIQERAGNDANIIWGAGYDPSLGTDVEVTIIATGFDVFPQHEGNSITGQDFMNLKVGQRKRAEEQQERRRWTPPTQEATSEYASGHPFGQRRSTIHPPLGQPAGQPNTQPQQMDKPKPGGFMPQHRSPVQVQVVAMSDEKRFDDIDNLMNVPAYVRRKVKFAREGSDETQKSTKVALKDEPQPEKATPQKNSSLFD